MSKFTLKDLVKEEIEVQAPKTTLWEPLTVEVKEPVKEFSSKTSRIGSLSSLNEDLKENKTVVKSGWTPLVQKTEQVSVIENVAARPRAGMKSLLEVNTDIQPIAVKKEPLDELVQSFTATIQKQEEVIRSPEPVIEPVTEPESIIETVEVEAVKEETLIDKASAYISSQVKNEDSFQQPVSVTPANFAEVSRKVKYLEEWLSKVSLAGPGGGEVRFLRLDDVNYSSWQDRDRHKILKYEPNINPAYDGVTFGFLTGDQGPIYSMKYDTTGYTSNANVAAGLVFYHAEHDTIEIKHADNTSTHVGLDSYIRFKNGLSNTITKGSLVQFAGSDLTDNVPLADLFTATTDATPLYIMGVSVDDCLPNTTCRAILLGDLERVDASGSSSGEVWSIGDLLWANPTMPGKLTNVRPTAPNVIVSIAAVLNNDSIMGRILVRPTIWPRLRAGDFYTHQQQLPPVANTAYQVAISNTFFTSGVTLSSNTISVTQSGLYKFDARAQVTSTNSSEKSIALWFKKNDVNVPFSTVRQSVTVNGSHATVQNSQIISLHPTDNVKIFFAVTDTSLYLDTPPMIDSSADIPSFQLTVTQPAL